MSYNHPKRNKSTIKLQTNTNNQIPITKQQPDWEIDDGLLFGAWNLVFGYCHII